MRSSFKPAAVSLILLLTVGALAQGENEAQLEWRAVRWAFPKEGVKSKQVGNTTVYELGKDTFGAVEKFNSREVRILTLPTRIIRAAELVHLQDPAGMPDVDKFLTAYAVGLAVETPDDFNNEYLGSGKLDGQTTYLYKTKGGANVGAIILRDRTMVLIMPAPSVK